MSAVRPSARPSRSLLHSAGDTDTGRQRERNEDAFYRNDAAGVYLVVDGMGGEAAGDVAAAIARRLVVARVLREEGDAEERIREGIALANNAIVRHVVEEPSCQGMGCVLTVAVMEGDALVVGHVGDTRLYRVREDGLEKLTPDHSPVGRREDHGELTEAEAMRHPARSVVDRALGGAWVHPDDDLVEVLRVGCEEADRFLLCTDGVTDQVEQAGVAARVVGRTPESAVEGLLAEADRRGGIDNATAIVLDVAS